MPSLSVTKCQSAGNDFVLLDNRRGAAFLYPEVARVLCRRRYGVGADGLLVLLPAAHTGCRLALRIFNADGSEAQMCGNGLSCIAKYVAQDQQDFDEIGIETMSGILRTRILSRDGADFVETAMGAPDLKRFRCAPSLNDNSSAFLVGMGNRHCVVFTDREIGDYDLADLISRLAKRSIDAAEFNVEAANAGGGAVAMRVWERGVGETLACGTGACAVAVSAILTRRARSPVDIVMPGGKVEVRWDGGAGQVYLLGQAELTFRAEVELPFELLTPARLA